LFIFTDMVESFAGFFKAIQDRAPFKVIVTTIKEFLGRQYDEMLKKVRSYDVFIAIDVPTFRTAEFELRNYLSSLEMTPFTNFLFLFKNLEEMNDKSIIQGHKHAYHLYECGDPVPHAASFVLFMVNLFNKAISAFRLSDYIYHSFKTVVYSEILKKKKLEIEMLNEELKRKNMIDDLTNLYNRSVIFKFLEREREKLVNGVSLINGEDLPPDVSVSRGGKGVFSIMMIDIDHFKDVNDTYGHLVGDMVLKGLGNLFRKEGILREQDIAGRFGGEEFTLILPGTPVDRAYEPAQRLMHELSEVTFSGTNNEKFKITLSIGISEYHADDKTNDDIIIRADKALYWAKQHGRNQIAIFERVYARQAEKNN
jgi:diguanylate cyclase (GGDEF)-like protein